MKSHPGIRWLQKPPLGYDLDGGHPLAAGLQGAWLLNDGGIASSAWDTSPYRNRLATPSHMSAVSDAPGWCLKPSTTSGYLAGTCNQGAVGYPFTVYGLLMLTAQQSQQCWFSHHVGGSSTGFHLAFSSTGNPQVNTSGTTQNFASMTLGTNQWYHLAVVCTGANKSMTAYLATWPGGTINSQSLTQTNTTPTGMNALALAGRQDTTGLALQGKLALASWWNYALTSAQITDLFADLYGLVLMPGPRRWAAWAAAGYRPPQGIFSFPPLSPACLE